MAKPTTVLLVAMMACALLLLANTAAARESPDSACEPGYNPCMVVKCGDERPVCKANMKTCTAKCVEEKPAKPEKPPAMDELVRGSVEGGGAGDRATQGLGVCTTRVGRGGGDLMGHCNNTSPCTIDNPRDVRAVEYGADGYESDPCACPPPMSVPAASPRPPPPLTPSPPFPLCHTQRRLISSLDPRCKYMRVACNEAGCAATMCMVGTTCKEEFKCGCKVTYCNK